MTGSPKRFVYILKSERDNRPYFGIASNVARWLETHNSGSNAATAPHRPWRLDGAVQFAGEERALQFERYLKSGSGRAFARRHLL